MARKDEYDHNLRERLSVIKDKNAKMTGVVVFSINALKNYVGDDLSRSTSAKATLVDCN